MAKKKQGDPKQVKAGAGPKASAVSAAGSPEKPKRRNPAKARKSGPKEPTPAQMTRALVAAVMDAPVDPALDIDPECVAILREQVAEMLARGIMVDIPDSCDDFDPNEFRD